MMNATARPTRCKWQEGLLSLTLLLSALLTACKPAGTPTMNDTAVPEALTETIRTSLQEDLLAPWYPRAIDTLYGGYLSDFNADWEAGPVQDKMIVTQARHIWMTARAAAFFPEQRDVYLAAAAQGVDFLREKMWDDEYGGFVSLVTRNGSWKQGRNEFTQGKTAYGNAFALYGLAAYADVSGDTAALGLAQRTFRWLDAHTHDPVHGGYFQFVTREGTALPDGMGAAPPKDQNSSIHVLEALTELYNVWPDPVLRDRLEEMLVLVRDTITTDPGYLQLFFQADWAPVSYRDSSEAVQRAHLYLDHVSFGHDVETAYLMLEAAHTLGLDPAPTLARGKQMVDHALAFGWDDTVGGFFDGAYYFKPNAPPTIVMEAKAWWAQAEALNTFLLLSEHYPDDEHRYYDHFLTMWTYIQTYLIDHERGGWYWAGLDREPEQREGVKGSLWKAAYHDGRALMNVTRQLEKMEDRR